MTTELYSQEVEEALLGYALMDPRVIPSLDIAPDDFYMGQHKIIWCILKTLDRRGLGIDLVMLSGALEETGQLSEIGGPAYLAKLVNSCPIGMSTDDYVQVILDKSDRRRAIQTAQELAKACHNEDGFEEAKAKAIDDLATSRASGGQTFHICEFAGALYDDVVERSKDPREIFGIDTGFLEWNRITGGLQRKELTLISGDPGIGKTLLVVQTAANMGSHSSPGVIYELEMGGMQLLRRIISADAGIQTRTMKTGNLKETEWPPFTQSIEKTSALPIWISDSTNWTTTSIRSDLTKLKAKYNIEWFVLDYLLLLTDPYGSNDIERSNYISKNVRRICKDLDLAGLAVHAMNKTGISTDNKNLSHLAGAVGVSYDADVVMFIQKHIVPTGETSRKNMRTVTFAKYREDDPSRFFHLVFKPGLPAFADYAHEPNAQRLNGRK